MDVQGSGLGSYMQGTAVRPTQRSYTPANEPTDRQGQAQRTDRIDDAEKRELQATLVAQQQRTSGVDAEEGVKKTQDEEDAKAAEARRLEAIARREEALENVVARSEDGDTLQVEEELADIKNEGIGGVVARGNGAAVPPGTEDIEAPEVKEEMAEDIQLKESLRRIEIQAENEKRAIERSEERKRLAEDVEDQDMIAEELDEDRISATEDRQRLSDAEERQKLTEAEEQDRLDGRQQFLKEAEESEESEAAEVQKQTSSNFIGISDNRLEQMYREGEISQTDYRKEVEAREAEREKRLEETNGFNREMYTIEQVGRNTEQMAGAISEASSENANEKVLSAEQKLDIVENLQRTNINESKRKEEERVVWQAQFLE